ncbi:MAG TPA: type I polyketide synthase, partial [Mycobacterium sp.]|nr:type I polyketide synthase [Mycobacterium sp.]
TAGRISYLLGLRGPAVAVDTACSSSLAAIHLACQSLRLRESDLALAGGVSVTLRPETQIAISAWGLLSPQGRCATFDAAADGFVRGEGAGLVVLKRLTDAVRDGDRVLAVVRGSAVNQDGRSNGITAPNTAAQCEVIADALRSADVAPESVHYVEAHGTGTALGDPIEFEALAATYGRGEGSCALGAVKTNIGHLEAASGVAGFIKAVLAVQRGQIPPNLHFSQWNPAIDASSTRFFVPVDNIAWPSDSGPRRAAVSSFGLGGTNAHAIVEQGPELVPVIALGSDTEVSTLVVSGKTPQRVAVTAGVLAEWMEGAGASVGLVEVAHTLNHHRARQARFGTVVARERAQAVAGLRALAAGQHAAGVVGPQDGSPGPGTVFVYSGRGSQWAGMGRQLLADEPAFAQAVGELDPVFVQQAGFSLHEVIAAGLELVGIEQIQLGLIGMQLALTALWRSYGVQPDLVIGHSMGEVAAAVVAGALTPAEGLRVTATRSRLMAPLSGQGGMALLGLDVAATEALIAEYPQVTLGIYNSPRQTVIAGPTGQIDELITRVRAQNRFASRVNIEVAPHNPAMDALQPQMRAELADLTPQTPTIPIISTTYEDLDTRPVFDAEHWATNMRNPVRFQQAITAAGTDHHTFIEISAHPLLTQAVLDTLHTAQHGSKYASVGTLQRDTDDTITFRTNLNTVRTTHPPQTPHPPEPHPQIPTTPWHHTHHWIDTTAARASSAESAPRAGTLLGQHTTVSSSPLAHVWQARLVPEAKPYPGEHRFHGVEVVPASVILHTILSAAVELGFSALSGVRFEQPILADQPRLIQVVADSESISLASSSAPDAPADRWTRHVTAQLSSPPSGPAITSNGRYQDNGHRHENAHHDAIPAVDELLAQRGVDGRPFEWSVDSWTATSAGMLAAITLPEASSVALLDAAVHIGPLAEITDLCLHVPASIEQVWLGDAVTEPRGSVAVNYITRDDDELIVDVTLAAHSGGACLSMRSLRYRAVPLGDKQPGEPGVLGQSGVDPRTFAHTIEWQPRHGVDDEPPEITGSRAIAVISDDGVSGTVFRKRLEDTGYVSAASSDARYVLYLADSAPTDATETDIDYAVRISAEVRQLVRILAERDAGNPVALWIVTRGVHEAVNAAGLRQSFLWGLAEVIAAEHPELWGGLVDLAFDADPGEAASALAGVLRKPSKSILVLRDGAVLAPTLAPLKGQPVRKSVRCRPDATYLVTGGMGALGLLMAAWLADRGARRLVLAGRTPLPPRHDWDRDTVDAGLRQTIDAIRALEMRGVAIEAAAVDVGCRDDVQALLAKRDRDGAPPIRGIIHAAGVTNDQLVTNMTDGAVREVMWPKISGGQVLHEAFPPGSVDFFFLIGSAAAIFGIPGQASYAAANAYLDALARARHQQGCHTLSLDWVAWRGLGVAADAELVSQELRRMGSREITPSEAFSAWEYIDTYNVAQAVVVPVPSPIGEDRSTVTDARLKAARDWSQMSTTQVRDELEAGLRSIIARELRLPETELASDRPFAELGLNSLMAMAIRREAEQFAGLELSATMLFNHPTVASLAEYLAKVIAPPADSETDAMTVLSASAGSVLDSLFDHIESTSADSERPV